MGKKKGAATSSKSPEPTAPSSTYEQERVSPLVSHGASCGRRTILSLLYRSRNTFTCTVTFGVRCSAIVVELVRHGRVLMLLSQEAEGSKGPSPATDNGLNRNKQVRLKVKSIQCLWFSGEPSHQPQPLPPHVQAELEKKLAVMKAANEAELKEANAALQVCPLSS